MFKTFGKKNAHRSNEDMALNITAMADIFTIILVFLLKSYAAGSLQLSPSKGLLLPTAVADSATQEALKVEISESAVLVENKPVLDLKGFILPKEDRLSNGASQKLNSALAQERKRQLLIAQSNTSVKIDPRILVIADKRAPYATIKGVLASAALNGYTDFKLAVVKGD